MRVFVWDFFFFFIAIPECSRCQLASYKYVGILIIIIIIQRARLNVE